MSTLLEPFGYDFFVRALIVATLTGALCGLIGTYVVLRGMSYIGHGLSHAIFGGAVASSVLSVPVVIGAGTWGLLAAIFINQVARRRSVFIGSQPPRMSGARDPRSRRAAGSAGCRRAAR